MHLFVIVCSNSTIKFPIIPAWPTVPAPGCDAVARPGQVLAAMADACAGGGALLQCGRGSGGSAQTSMAEMASKKKGGEQKQVEPVTAHSNKFQSHGSVRKGCFLRDPPSLAEPTRSPRSTRLACPVRPFPITQTTSLDSNQVASHNVVAAAIKLQDRLLRHFTLRKDVEDFSTQYSAESHSKTIAS